MAHGQMAHHFFLVLFRLETPTAEPKVVVIPPTDRGSETAGPYFEQKDW